MVIKKELNVGLQRLRDAPVENEDAFQHIDDDMLAQVVDHIVKGRLEYDLLHSFLLGVGSC